MSDPIRDLENLMHEGIDVNPLPASEVRRRGTRLRRRNNALIGAGALAVALVVATPIAVVAGGGDHADDVPVAPSPSPSRTADVGWRQTIPGSSDDFDLTALPDSATFRFTVRPLPVVDDLTLCGSPTFSTGAPTGPDAPVAPAVDVLGAAHGEAGTDGNAGRTLALYRDDRVAAKVLDAVRHGVEACPTDPNGKGAPLVYAAVDTGLPVDESFVFTQQAQMDKDLLADLTVFQVARVGNAIYLATDHTSAGGAQVVDAEVRRLAEWSAPVLSDMCIFAAEPCRSPSDGSSASASPVIGEGAVSAIPADFPLDWNIAAPEGPLDGPSAKAEGVPAPDLCGRSPWPAADTVERLAVTSTMPQFRESRELVTFARTDDATATLAQIREAVQGCPVIPGDKATDDKLVDVQPVDDADLGGADDSVTFSIVYREGLGGGIFQFARVGRAVYGTYVEGEYARDSIGQAVTGLSGKTKSIVTQMCLWTEQGC
ncbi:hypothetical protein [Nocardioides panaciterrulae]|uniref:Uncharacterized protein n=1 Tax=Nocardioides panaciterrulae TaxID=661492 RepID=A0A7Y9E4H9_9ACTN|nr:hypothetical protein [Nocardioides panaciterrulae]NYD40817.1 hypothetical protein [Nocardioides panaciterrulae]